MCYFGRVRYKEDIDCIVTATTSQETNMYFEKKIGIDAVYSVSQMA